MSSLETPTRTLSLIALYVLLIPLRSFCNLVLLLCQEQPISLLDRNAMPRVLVIRGEACRVRALANFAVDDLLERVDALGRVCRIGNVH